jgi:hypothetical protein
MINLEMELVDDSDVFVSLRERELAENEVFVGRLLDVSEAELVFRKLLHFPSIGPVVSALALKYTGGKALLVSVGAKVLS